MSASLLRASPQLFELLSDGLGNTPKPFSVDAIGFMCNALQLRLYALVLRSLTVLVGSDPRALGYPTPRLGTRSVALSVVIFPSTLFRHDSA